jgi:imidazoleglycerol-phosphate dehydratase
MIGADVEPHSWFFQGLNRPRRCTSTTSLTRNAHHQCETVKAFARALRMAAMPDPRAAGTVPSTKGTL